MATLYVRNVRSDLYEALRRRARAGRRSIAAEVLVLLEENIPTERELKARKEFLRKVGRMRERKTQARGIFPSTEEMQRDDRTR
jgi:plasmid stability protein